MSMNFVKKGSALKITCFALIVCLVMTIPMFGGGQAVNAETGAATIDMSKATGDVTIAKSGGYITASGVGFESGSAANPTSLVITGTTASSLNLTVNGKNGGSGMGDDFDITLSGASIEINAGFKAGMLLNDGAQVDLTLQGVNRLKGGSLAAGLQVSSPCSVDIKGSGSLTATGVDGGAGIGGGDHRAGSNITITGEATVTATGGEQGAGIGGSFNGAGSNIAITGEATVTATGGDESAGIGGGNNGAGSDITISDNATVTATGGGYGAGIGGGSSSAGSDISISDNATVTATGGDYGAGIGGGYVGAGSDISISDNAAVTATGGSNGAGIGGGSSRAGSDISISGSAIVTATGGSQGAGIGGGFYGAGSSISISDNAAVTATGGSNGAGIGGGASRAGSDISISGGFVTAAGSNSDDIGGYSGYASSVIITGGSVYAVYGKIASVDNSSTLQDGIGNDIYKVTVPAVKTGTTKSLKGNYDISVPLPGGGSYNAKTVTNGSISEHGAGFSAGGYIYLPEGGYSSITVGAFGSGYANVSAGSVSATDNIVLWKPEPTVTWPTGLTATEGQVLGDITLPGNGISSPAGIFSWTKGNNTSVGKAGTQKHNMTFTPQDTETYETVTADVSVTVTKKQNDPKPVPAVKSYKVTFDPSGGKIKAGSKKTKMVKVGAKYGKLPKAVKNGFNFKGWYTKKKGGTRITSAKTMKYRKNIKLYAHWTANAKVANCKYVHLRKGPGVSKFIKTYIKKGTKVSILGSVKVNGHYKWYKVKVGKKTGYIYSKYVKKV